MRMRLPIALVAAGLIGAGGFAVTLNARAQQSTPNDPPSSDTMQNHGHGDDQDRWGKFSPADRAAFFDARIAAMHAGLTLTPDQDKLWPPIETAVRDTAKTMVEQRKMWRDEPRPADPVQMLQRISGRSLARGEALKKLADALTPLYATLNDDQKRRLPILLAHLKPHPMHFAMMERMGGDHRFGPEGGDRGSWRHDGRDGGYGHDRDRSDDEHLDRSEH